MIAKTVFVKIDLRSTKYHIDLRKAYDYIDRNILWYKLRQQGVNGKFYFALGSLYRNTECSVMLNGLQTPWFNVECGLRQGCNLSPLLFNIIINELVEQIQRLNRGLDLLFIRVSFQLHGEHTVLQPFRRIKLIVHIAIPVLPGTNFHLSQVKHLRVKCLAQGHNILKIPRLSGEKT